MDQMRRYIVAQTNALKILGRCNDPEVDHYEADHILLSTISFLALCLGEEIEADLDELAEAYIAIHKWYA